MRKRRNWILSLALSLVITVTGCGSQSSEKPASSAQGGSAQEKVKITLGMHVANVKDQEPATYGVVEAFMEQNPNITVEIQGTEQSEHLKKMKMMAQSDTLPDVFWILPAPAKELEQAGMLLDLSDFIKQNNDIATSFYPNMLNAYQVDGKQYGLPYQPLVTGLWYNKSLFDKYGLKVPETYEDLLAAAKVFKQNQIVTIAKGAKDPYSVWALLGMFTRYGYFDHIDKILAKQEKYHNPDFLKFYQKLDELRQAGAFPENVSTLNYFQAVEMFLSGQAAMLDAGVWETKKIEQSKIGNDVGFWWGPTFQDGVGNQKVSMIVPAAPLVANAKLKSDQDKYEAVMKFLKFYYGKEGAKIMVDNLVPPMVKYDGDTNKESHPVFAKVLDEMNKQDWKSPSNQPDLVVPENIGNAMYDSIYGVINGIYKPEEALDIVDKKIAEQ